MDYLRTVFLKNWIFQNIGLLYAGLSVIFIYLINLTLIDNSSNIEVIALYKFLVIASWISIVANLGKDGIMIVKQKNKQNLMLSNTLMKQCLMIIFLFTVVNTFALFDSLLNIYHILIYIIILRVQETIGQYAILKIPTNLYFINFHFLKSVIWFCSYIFLNQYFDSIPSFLFGYIFASLFVSLNLLYLSSTEDITKKIFHNSSKEKINEKNDNLDHLAYWFNNIISVTIITITNLSINYVEDGIVIATFYIAMRLSSVYEQINTYYENKSMHHQSNKDILIGKHIFKTVLTSTSISLLITLVGGYIIYLSGYYDVINSKTTIGLFILFMLIHLCSAPIKCISNLISIYFNTKNLYALLSKIMFISLIVFLILFLSFYITKQWFIIFFMLLIVPVIRIIFYWKIHV